MLKNTLRKSTRWMIKISALNVTLINEFSIGQNMNVNLFVTVSYIILKSRNAMFDWNPTFTIDSCETQKFFKGKETYGISLVFNVTV